MCCPFWIASSIETTSNFFAVFHLIVRLPLFVPSSVVQYVASSPSTTLPGLKSISFPRTLDAVIVVPSAFTRFVLNVSSRLFPNSVTLSRIAWSTVPWLFGGTFRSIVPLCPTESKYIVASWEIVFGVHLFVPQNHPDVIRPSHSGTVHLLPFSYPFVYGVLPLLSIVFASTFTVDFDHVSS